MSALIERAGGRSGPGSEVEAGPADFHAPLEQIELRAPPPLGRAVLWTFLVFLAVLLAWAAFGRLDIVAVAEGKLVPQSYLKIVQPAEGGVIKEILVREGERVAEGQVLMRMDPTFSDADGKSVLAEVQHHRLALRRIDAELSSAPLAQEPDDPPHLYAQFDAQMQARREALAGALAHERSVLEKARQELAAAKAVRDKLRQVLPHYRRQDQAFGDLAREGYVGRVVAGDKQRERIEKEQDLKTQEHVIRSAQATIAQAERRIEQIEAEQRQKLQTERVEVLTLLEKADQALAKQRHRHALLELKAPRAGIVKDLATHTAGTVTSPGTVLTTLVPLEEGLRAEVWVTNEDVGFVRPRQPVKLKVSAFQFQKYGMIDGTVEQVSADASAAQARGTGTDASGRTSAPLAYKTLVAIGGDALVADGVSHPLVPGMQVAAEIHLGTRTVLEYLLSPVAKAFHEAGRER